MQVSERFGAKEVIQRLSCSENTDAREMGVKDLEAFVVTWWLSCLIENALLTFCPSSAWIFPKLTSLKSSSRSPGWYIWCAARR